MSALVLRTSGLVLAFRSLIKAFILTLLFYLLQTSVAPHLKLGGVLPNLLMVCIAVLTVSKGKKYAFASGAMIGILLEVMSTSMSLFNLLLYPSLALLCAQLFADMSELRREMLRIRIAQRQADRRSGVIQAPNQRRFRIQLRRRSAEDLNPHLRILLNTMLLTLLYELIMLAYIALDGVAVTGPHLSRAFRTLLYTMSASVLMFPARAYLSMYKRRKHRGGEGSLGKEVSISEKELQSIALEPDLPSVNAQLTSEAVAPPSDPDLEQTVSAVEDEPIVTEPAKEEPDEN